MARILGGHVFCHGDGFWIFGSHFEIPRCPRGIYPQTPNFKIELPWQKTCLQEIFCHKGDSLTPGSDFQNRVFRDFGFSNLGFRQDGDLLQKMLEVHLVVWIANLHFCLIDRHYLGTDRMTVSLSYRNQWWPNTCGLAVGESPCILATLVTIIIKRPQRDHRAYKCVSQQTH